METLSLPPWLKRPGVFLMVFTVFVVIIAAGSGNLTFRGDYRVFFADDNPQLQAFDTIERTFNKNDNLSVVIAPPNGQLFTPKYLTLVRDLTEAAWQVPYSTRVDSISNYQHTEAIDDDLLVADLLPKFAAISDEHSLKAQNVALNQVELLSRLVSVKGDVAVINITVHLDEANKTEQALEIASFSENLVAQFAAQYPEVEFHRAGIVMMNYNFFNSAQQDSSTLVPLMFLIVLLVLGAMLRSITAIVATFTMLIAAIASTLGVAGWFGMAINTASVNVPTIVMTLAVADCVHIIASMRHRLSEGASKYEALAFAIKVNNMPVFITSATTAIGFLTMNFSDVPAIRDLGNLTAVGVMIAWLLSISLLPALLYFLPQTVKVNNQAAQQQQLLARFGVFITEHAKAVFIVSAVLVAVAGSFITENKINDEAVKYFNKNNEFRQAADFMQARVSGMSTLSVAMDSGHEGGISDPEFLNTVDTFSQWLRAQPEVNNVVSISDIQKRLNKSMHGDDPAFYATTQSRQLAAQYLLMYEMSLPYGLDLNNQIDIAKSQSRVMMVLNNLGSKEMMAFEQRMTAWLSQNASQYSFLTSSPDLMFAHIGERNMQSMLTSLPLALLLISVLLIVALKDWRLGAMSLLPNILPALAGFGLWALISGEINLGLSIVASMTLGIIVDDTVHFLSKYQYAKRNGRDAAEAVQYAFVTVGKALWITTVVLVAGFGMLALSDFRLNSDMGQLTALVISIALLVDFFLLPAFLVLFDRSTQPEGSHERISVTTA